MLTLTFAPFGPPRPPAPFVPPPGMRLQEYVLAYDEGRKRTVYLAAHDHGAAFGDAYLFDGSAWTQVATGSLLFPTAQKLFGFYDEARAGVAAWSFKHDFQAGRFVATSLLFDVRDGLSPIVTRGDEPVAEVEGARVGTFDYRGLFAPDPSRAVTVCVTRAGVWELDADAVWHRRASHEPSFPREWDDDGAGAAFDPVRKRAVFWLFTRAPSRGYAFFAWDGRALARLPAVGLPMERLHFGLFDPGALVSAHPVHGLVLFAGAHGAFAFDGARWTALPEPRGARPPRMKYARVTWDAHAGGLVVGPGDPEGDRGGREQQRVFYAEKDGEWTLLGERSEPSALADLSHAMHAFAGRAWTAVAPSDLATLRWTDDGFAEIVSAKDGKAVLDGDRGGALVCAGARTLAITQHGAVLELEGAAWKRVRGPHRPFGDRSGFCATWDAARERVVVFGGSVKDRASVDTFFFDGEAWRAAKEPSPLPADGRGRDDPYVDFVLAFDGALGRVLRFARSDVAALDGDVWTPLAVDGYAELGGARAWERLPLHDPKTGETVLVNLARAEVHRFDLAGCTLVAKLELPAELAPQRQHDEAAHHAIASSLCFDPESRVLHAQHAEERSHRYAVDLGPAFDAARALGSRTPRPARAESRDARARLYHVEKRAYWFLDGASATSGALGARAKKTRSVADASAAIAAKRKAGYVRADELDLDALAALGARESRALVVGKKAKLAKTSVSRVGGLPSGVAERAWPARRKKPLGFLLQLDCRAVLHKHAGVAVFCATDGTATEAESNNAAVLLTAAAWKKKPSAAPRGVPVLDARAVVTEAPRPELDEARVRELAEADPAMGAAFDRFQKSAKVQSLTASKLGGAPVFLQSAEMRGKYTFLCQVDFDGIPNDWGLAGCVYVFVHPSEKDAVAFWQCT